MRQARANDYWEKVYARRYNNTLLEVDLNGLNKLERIAFSEGILAICGVNGAGKSTVISAIKSVLGLPLSDHDQSRIKDYLFTGKATLDDREMMCANQDGKRMTDNGWQADQLYYYDASECVKIQQFFIAQTNLNELLEQFDELEFDDEQLAQLHYLIGKEYSACTVREMEDVNGDAVYPYFEVQINDESYDSLGMGCGEHSLILLYWMIERAPKDSMIILEEPETFISISSQIHLANYLAQNIAEKGLKVILSTHSPFVLRSIKNSNVRIISRLGTNTQVSVPTDMKSVESILGLSSQEEFCIGTFFVEDKVGEELLIAILRDQCPDLLRRFTIEVVGGEAEITKRLKYPYSERVKYKFVGIYDGDQRGKITDLNWNCCFLPGKLPLEKQLREYLRQKEFLFLVCGYLGISEEEAFAYLASIDGENYHDWLLDFGKRFQIEPSQLVEALYLKVLKENTKNEIELFVKEVIAAM